LLLDPGFFTQRCALNMMAGNSDLPSEVRGHVFPLVLNFDLVSVHKALPVGAFSLA
jgi:hypothetical protein